MARRFLLQTIVLAYLLVTAGAFVYTMTGYAVLPVYAIYWSYGMMAPYQSDSENNTDIFYEGILLDGSSRIISLDPYMPYASGERGARESLRLYQSLGKPLHRRMFTAFALQLLAHERERGRDYRAIRVYYDTWPRSPAGYQFLHTPVFTTHELLTEVR